MYHSNLTTDEILRCISYAENSHFILFVGACGTGMSALCRLLYHRDVHVVAYDDFKGGEYQRLCNAGIPFLPSTEHSLDGCSLIVYSLAIDEGHPLLQNDFPRCSRAQLLGAIMRSYPTRIAIAGSHGKSTVTALVHRLLMQSGKNPTTLSGAALSAEEGTLHIGGEDIFLYECCEYRDSFLYTSPTHAVLLNLDLDHTDYFADIDALKASFLRFASLAQTVLYLQSDDNLREIIQSCTARAFSLALTNEATKRRSDFHGVLRPKENGFYPFELYAKNQTGSFLIKPRIPGRVGALNTLFALSLTTILDISLDKTARFVESLVPIDRRMSKIGYLYGHAVYYDFAHHPTEMCATVETLCEMYGAPPCAVFAPHTYSRTRDLWDGFVDALSLCHLAFICPIYPAREEPVEGITADALAAAVGGGCATVSSLSDLRALCGGGAIVLMGAGDLSEIKGRIQKDPAFVREKEIL